MKISFLSLEVSYVKYKSDRLVFICFKLNYNWTWFIVGLDERSIYLPSNCLKITWTKLHEQLHDTKHTDVHFVADSVRLVRNVFAFNWRLTKQLQVLQDN